MPITLTNIPRIMRKQSPPWLNGARLLEQWFPRPVAINPNYGPPDTTTIRMDSFVLTFPRGRQAYDRIMNEQLWTTPNARRQIIDLLDRNGRLAGAASAFGNLTGSVPQIDPDHITEVAVVGDVLADPFDDMRAALFNFTLRVLVAGTVTPVSQSRWQVLVQQVGVYVRDSFDFEGNQFLGYWDDTADIFYPINPGIPELVPVGNADFRTWRQNNGTGGDFLVFSDVKPTTLAHHHLVDVGAADVLVGRLPGSIPPRPWPWRSTDAQQRWHLEFTTEHVCMDRTECHGQYADADGPIHCRS